MTTQEGTPAGWYEDPAKVGELRYYDGTQWTEHVTINGVQTTAPFEAARAAAADSAAASSFAMSRAAQSRTEPERALPVLGPAGAIGTFVATLDGAPGYRFHDVQGTTVLEVAKPSLKNAIEISDPAGGPIGRITKVGRLHARYEVQRPHDSRTATVKLLPGATDRWEVHLGDDVVATVTRMTSTPADPLTFAAVDYTAAITGPLDDGLQRLLLAVPLTIDILETQAL